MKKVIIRVIIIGIILCWIYKLLFPEWNTILYRSFHVSQIECFGLDYRCILIDDNQILGTESIEELCAEELNYFIGSDSNSILFFDNDMNVIKNSFEDDSCSTVLDLRHYFDSYEGRFVRYNDEYLLVPHGSTTGNLQVTIYYEDREQFIQYDSFFVSETPMDASIHNGSEIYYLRRTRLNNDSEIVLFKYDLTIDEEILIQIGVNSFYDAGEVIYFTDVYNNLLMYDKSTDEVDNLWITIIGRIFYADENIILSYQNIRGMTFTTRIYEYDRMIRRNHLLVEIPEHYYNFRVQLNTRRE